MSRFSPTQRASDVPGGLGGLAAALNQGVGAFQDQRDRQEGQRDRERKRTIESDVLFAKEGIAPKLPETPEGFGDAFARALSGSPMPTPRPPAPGAFVVEMGDFEKVDPRTGQPAMALPSGGTFDPRIPQQNAAGMQLAKGRAENQLGVENRDTLQGELGAAVEQAGGKNVYARDLPTARSYLEKPTSEFQFTPANAGNPAGQYNKRTGQWEPLKGTNPVPRTAGGLGGDRVTAAARNALASIEKTTPLLDRAIQLATSNPDAFGLKNFAGPIATDIYDKAMRGDEDAMVLIQTRSAMENIVSELRHELYGAALTRPEIQRALLNLPDVKQNPLGVLVRLQELKVVLDAERSALGVAHGMVGAPVPRQPMRQRPNNPDDY